MYNAINWFARNAVAANLLMLIIIALGSYAVFFRTPLEVFPNIQLNVVNIDVTLRGATPTDIEKSITIRIEEAVQNLEGIEQIVSNSREGRASIRVEVKPGYDERILMEDIKIRVDAINTLPDQAENPVVRLSDHTSEVISVVVIADISETELRIIAEQVRDELLRFDTLTRVNLDAARPYEISIEIPEPVLREYDLTLADIANAVRRSSIDLSAGSIKARSGEVLIRSVGQAYNQQEFGDITIRTLSDGARLKLRDIAIIHDGFEEEQIETRFNGRNAQLVEIYRVGDQSAIEVAETVKDYIQEANARMPQGITLTYWKDRSKVVRQRLSTLTTSAIQGGLLVLLLLTLFLRPAVAFWVCIGIPISFFGGLFMMPILGVTLNVISLFAFILVLGIVVDDAIVTGENIYRKGKELQDPLQASIVGAQEVSIPVTFGILTTVAAFVPLLVIDGVRGQIFANIPMVVIPVLLFSIVESKFILPAHLRHLNYNTDSSQDSKNVLFRLQEKIANGFESAILKYYRPTLDFCLNHRFLVIAVFTGIIIVVASIVFSGWTKFVFFPRVQSEVIRAQLTMPTGSPFELTRIQVKKIEAVAYQLQEEYRDADSDVSVIKNILSTTGSSGGAGGGKPERGRVWIELISPEERSVDVTSSELAKQWRQGIGEIPGAESLVFRSELARGGNPIEIQLAGNNLQLLQTLAEDIKEKLGQYPNVFDIGDSLSEGKEEFQLYIKPEAETLGITLSDLANQVRQAFFGFEVQRIQRGREEVRVMVRYPAEQRKSLQTLNDMIIRSPSGVEVPFSEVVDLIPARSPTVIKRIDRNRLISITADIDKEKANLSAIKQELQTYLVQLMAPFPEIEFTFEGEAKEQRKSLSSLVAGFVFVFFIIYCLLAIPFKSYSQPFIVLSVFPFGVVGAIMGHWIMGKNLSIMSFMGILALTGVVVNDSLVLVDYINKRRAEGLPLFDAIRTAGVDRFRPVLLTSLTTFAGLTPLLLDKSTQAQFLIPMAISLGFGVLFATTITLILVPINYLILESSKTWISETYTKLTKVPVTQSATPATTTDPDKRHTDY
ncbi:MAG: acriflavine resistance protein B [Gammaproteobacteria bacterium]|nr:MAG: acriflavine resistance protein B [Gammaproteobacteria bacterium]